MIKEKIRAFLKEHIQADERLQAIIDDIIVQGGRVLLVGGAVRDLLLDRSLKDLDIEVHGIVLPELENIFRKHGTVSSVGKAYGVLRVYGLDIDWSVPRSDAPGRKPMVHLDPAMSIRTAFERRDLTMNAMGIDLATGELIDPFDGYQDIQDKILRTPNPTTFVEDPLRLFRVMQFVSRFAMEPDETLDKLCVSMDVSGVSRERIEQEMEKMLLKSKKPSLGLRWLARIGRLRDIFPELAVLQGLEQDPGWHPEGDVFEHTMQALDAAAQLEYRDDEEKKVILYAALCHDLGKITKTQIIDGVIRNLGHAKESVRSAKKLLRRITRNNDLIKKVCILVHYHMHPLQLLASDAPLSAYKRLAYKLSPDVTMSMLAKLMVADRQGRNPHGHEPLQEIPRDVVDFNAMIQKAQVKEQREEPLLQGRDLFDVMEPGPRMGEVLKRAYRIQLEQGVQDKEELKKLVLKKTKEG